MKYKEVIKILKVARPTIYSYVKKGKIRATKINHSLLDYNEEDVFKVAGITTTRGCAVYARSLNEDKINEQIEMVTNYAIANGYGINEVYKDSTNGFTLDRPELNRLIDDLHNCKIKTLFVLSKDVLSINSFDTLEKICNLNHCEIVVINKLQTSDMIKEIDALKQCIKFV